MVDAAVPFSLDAYGRLLAALAERGYEARFFADADPRAAHLILRHDIDLSIDAALLMAEAEAALGLRATYFVLVRSDLYNPFAPAGAHALARIAGLGHAVGLHLDASVYGDDPRELDAAARRECEVLESLLERPVEVISFHRPAKRLLGYEARLAGRLHAYQPRFFRDMGYCSDSGGGWRHGAPLDHPAVAEGRALQVLTHPVWWTGAGGESPAARLDAFLRDHHARAARTVEATVTGYRAPEPAATQPGGREP